ncbi:hypothetical protein K456DRAFT_1758236 [Colletotrichum gloeosporioides 23]|nr:hypothetical protein K456DRAFT_1758236 [Colletotrichum gloeosporioides 23]
MARGISIGWLWPKACCSACRRKARCDRTRRRNDRNQKNGRACIFGRPGRNTPVSLTGMKEIQTCHVPISLPPQSSEPVPAFYLPPPKTCAGRSGTAITDETTAQSQPPCRDTRYPSKLTRMPATGLQLSRSQKPTSDTSDSRPVRIAQAALRPLPQTIRNGFYVMENRNLLPLAISKY